MFFELFQFHVFIELVFKKEFSLRIFSVFGWLTWASCKMAARRLHSIADVSVTLGRNEFNLLSICRLRFVIDQNSLTPFCLGQIKIDDLNTHLLKFWSALNNECHAFALTSRYQITSGSNQASLCLHIYILAVTQPVLRYTLFQFCLS